METTNSAQRGTDPSDLADPTDPTNPIDPTDPRAQASSLEVHLKHGCRFDFRTFTQARDVTVSTNVFSADNSSCYGSSMVRIGDTSVMCGISLLTGVPAIDSPGEGDVVFDVSFLEPRSTELDRERQTKGDASYVLESMLDSVFIR
jgi:exosome complex RNA-binding protein Rrp42 (RNase PH superfamily)